MTFSLHPMVFYICLTKNSSTHAENTLHSWCCERRSLLAYSKRFGLFLRVCACARAHAQVQLVISGRTSLLLYRTFRSASEHRIKYKGAFNPNTKLSPLQRPFISSITA